ncbi:hypothetical protein, partial [Sulfobacillus harzensis]
MSPGWPDPLSVDSVPRAGRSPQRGLGAPGRPITAAWIRMMERGAEGLISSVDRERVNILALVFDIPADALATPEVPEQTGHA